MNAKVTLTVPMNQIPEEIQRQLNVLCGKLQTLSIKTRDIVSLEDHVKLLNGIDDIRKDLTVVDANFEDCYSIVIGYLKYQAEIRMRNMKQNQVPSQEQNNDKQSNG